MQENRGPFARGGANTAYARYFVGNSYLNMLSTEGVIIGNVTFEPGCRNNWHIHEAASGGGQILLCTAGRGWYQEWGRPARELHAGDVVHIPAGVRHWHGAARDSWFVHLAVEVPGEDCRSRWLEPVSEEEYARLPSAGAPCVRCLRRRVARRAAPGQGKKGPPLFLQKTAAAGRAGRRSTRGRGAGTRPGRTRRSRRRSAGLSRRPAWTSYGR